MVDLDTTSYSRIEITDKNGRDRVWTNCTGVTFNQNIRYLSFRIGVKLTRIYYRDTDLVIITDQ